jgi:small subunit ribosomal protein S27Ae
MADKKGAKKGAWNTFEKKGDKLAKKNKYCPKCGSGFTLAAHKDRAYCGACHYTEFQQKAPAPEKK